MQGAGSVGQIDIGLVGAGSAGGSSASTSSALRLDSGGGVWVGAASEGDFFLWFFARARGLRLASSIGETPPAYRFERDVEDFFRHSPAVVRPDGPAA